MVRLPILFPDSSPLILDGGLATALETRGHDLNHPLWSGKLLTEEPEEITRVHLDFFRAGANIAITASYQTSVDGLKKHLGLNEEQSLEVIKSSVRLAQEAYRQAVVEGIERTMFIAGSVGPYGAYLANGAEYTGDYGNITAEELRKFHEPRIDALLEAGADVLACETMPNMIEIEVLAEILESRKTKAWLSCTLKDNEHISDGTPISEVIRKTQHCQQIMAYGVNCVPLTLAGKALSHFEKATSKELVVYPNSGEQWDAEKKVWYGGEEAREHLGELAKEWYNSRARLIGGCCRMGFEDIKVIRGSLRATFQP
ncbi:Homocysteine S-methyltransferase-like protein [Elsinoe fawcettii]|nr:Homocysteine S-methyltransferase-like protein [Elsinoe fawcettii]